MPSAVSVCSNALLSLGAKPISSFDEPTEFARVCSNLYATTRDDVLRAHFWNCATKRVQLAPMVDKPAFDYTAQFQLPDDWLRNIQVGSRDGQIDFLQEGQRILASVTVLPLVYVFRNDQEATWTANLVKLMEQRMAAEIAYTVTKSTTERDSRFQIYTQALKVAKAIDGQDNPPEEFAEGQMIEARFSAR
ncbi:hypothetical protein [Ralstonia mannitolilytica]|uniref:hypothetical protein n=1 Tax=Ralstonia mannitolilytica TaxID=105219 RepID=UPI00292E18E6|nr:hypothetical protein [Ralstonia mannitolilytica]